MLFNLMIKVQQFGTKRATSGVEGHRSVRVVQFACSPHPVLYRPLRAHQLDETNSDLLFSVGAIQLDNRTSLFQSVGYLARDTQELVSIYVV